MSVSERSSAKSPDDDAVIEFLRRAAAAVEAANPPSDLRVAAFRAAAEMLRAGTQGEHAPAQAKETKDAPVDRSASGDDVATEKIAKKLGLDASQVGRVFDVDSEGVHLTVARSALDKSKRTAMREVVQLIVASRQALGEEWTPLNELRVIVEDRGVLDAPNWALAMRPLDGKGFRFRGGSSARELKINQAGYEDAATLVKRVVAGG